MKNLIYYCQSFYSYDNTYKQYLLNIIKDYYDKINKDINIIIKIYKKIQEFFTKKKTPKIFGVTFLLYTGVHWWVNV